MEIFIIKDFVIMVIGAVKKERDFLISYFNEINLDMKFLDDEILYTNDHDKIMT